MNAVMDDGLKITELLHVVWRAIRKLEEDNLRERGATVDEQPNGAHYAARLALTTLYDELDKLPARNIE